MEKPGWENFRQDFCIRRATGIEMDALEKCRKNSSRIIRQGSYQFANCLGYPGILRLSAGTWHLVTEARLQRRDDGRRQRLIPLQWRRLGSSRDDDASGRRSRTGMAPVAAGLVGRHCCSGASLFKPGSRLRCAGQRAAIAEAPPIVGGPGLLPDRGRVRSGRREDAMVVPKGVAGCVRNYFGTSRTHCIGGWPR